jgi:hypothetical protein
MLDLDPALANRAGQVIIADKGYRSAVFGRLTEIVAQAPLRGAAENPS